MFRIFLISAFLLGVIGCVPSHTVRPLPDFVTIAIEPGDTVIVKTGYGEEMTFEVEEVTEWGLRGGDYLVLLEDIESLKKVGWRRPESPCGGEKPVGCSVPILVRAASDAHSHYADVFHDACVQHDYCYRHGYSTYGYDREACDNEFSVNMEAQCPAIGKVGVLEMLDFSITSRRACLNTAKSMYRAVRNYGEDKFRSGESSTVCLYDGPPKEAETEAAPN